VVAGCTLITRLAERGIDLKAIAEIARHSRIRTTVVYVESNRTAGRDLVSTGRSAPDTGRRCTFTR